MRRGIPISPKNVHGEEAEIETEKHDPEAQLTESLVEHAAGHLWPPVIDSCKNRKYIGADDYIVNMGDHVVSVVYLPIDRNDAGENAVQVPRSPAAQSHPTAIEHGCGEHRLPFQIVATQANTCTVVKMEMVILPALKKLIAISDMPT